MRGLVPRRWSCVPEKNTRGLSSGLLRHVHIHMLSHTNTPTMLLKIGVEKNRIDMWWGLERRLREDPVSSSELHRHLHTWAHTPSPPPDACTKLNIKYCLNWWELKTRSRDGVTAWNCKSYTDVGWLKSSASLTSFSHEAHHGENKEGHWSS